MGNFITDIKNSFKRGTISLQYIYINIGIFIFTSLVGVCWLLFNQDGTSWCGKSWAAS